MTTKTIVILGITGGQGASVANTFLALSSWNIVGITRNPSSPTALSLSAKGVKLLQADLNDPSTLTTIFEGATVIFSTTDFWAPFFNPATRSLLTLGQTVNEYCYEQELQQQKNIADAAAKVVGLERFIVASLVDAEECSGGKFKGVYHFDSKARGVKYVREVYPELADKMSVVLVGNYYANWQTVMKLMKGPDGGYRFANPGSGVRAVPQIDIAKDLGNIVYAAVQAAPGKTIMAASTMLSWTEMLKIWCEINKVPFGGYDPVPVEIYAQYVPVPGLGVEVGEMMAFMDEFGYDGGVAGVVSPSELGVECPLTSWEDYVKGQDWTKVLEG